jgi:predicted RNase H-like HicB family nuclease
MRYLIVVEKTETGYSAYSPDIEGCVATGSAMKEVEQAMLKAIEFHIEGLRMEGYDMPSPRSTSKYVEVSG